MVSYFNKIKSDPEKYELEKKRVNELLYYKYHYDIDYRNKKLEYQKQYRLKKK
jgi:hypothetical protein